jgi:hypothetical protein
MKTKSFEAFAAREMSSELQSKITGGTDAGCCYNAVQSHCGSIPPQYAYQCTNSIYAACMAYPASFGCH